jgi:RES domain-containing protein
MSRIAVPEGVAIIDVPESVLTAGWDAPVPGAATQEYGRNWVSRKLSAILRVPSAVVPHECNYVINVSHPEFGSIAFGPAEPFRFDPRLK